MELSLLIQTLNNAISKIKALKAENSSLKRQLSSVQDDRAIVKQLMSENSALQQKLNHYELIYGEKNETKALSKESVSISLPYIKSWLNAAMIEVNGVSYISYPENFDKEESEKIVSYLLGLKINGIPILEKPDDNHIISNYSIAQIISFLAK